MKEQFGITAKGETAHKYTLTNTSGCRLVVSDFGALLLELHVPDRQGTLADVVLGYDNLADYEENPQSIGATVGRHANRIQGASFTLHGKTYELAHNDHNNNLHSNPDSYFKRMWQAEDVEDTELGQSITFTLFSPDGDQGFPGNVHVAVTYTLTEENEVMIHYEAETDEDTIVNLTNHSYFNLAGHDGPSIENHIAWINASFYTVADSESIPTGEIAPVEGTPMDFRTPKPIGQDINSDFVQIQYGIGYDHNWVLDNHGEMGLVASLYDTASGRKMEVYTDLPGMQFYAGNFLDNIAGKGGAVYGKRTGVCYETQYFPDAIHHPNFPSPVLKAGEIYDTTTVYKFGTEE